MSRLVQVKEYMSRAEEIKNMLQNGQAAAQPPSNGQGVGQQAKPKDGGGGGGGGGGGENVSRPVTCLASVACLAALLMLSLSTRVLSATATKVPIVALALTRRKTDLLNRCMRCHKIEDGLCSIPHGYLAACS